MKAIKPLITALDATLANDLNRAVNAAFGETFGLSVVAGRYVIAEGPVSLKGDVSGICGFVQEKLEGTMIASFNTACIRAILPRLLGDGVAVTQEVIVDAVGEITNMIFSSIKTALNERGYSVRFGLPSVVGGAGHFISHIHNGRYMLMPFTINGSEFQIHLALHSET